MLISTEAFVLEAGVTSKAAWIVVSVVISMATPVSAQMSGENLIGTYDGFFLQHQQRAGGVHTICKVDDDQIKQAQEAAFRKQRVPIGVEFDPQMDISLDIRAWLPPQSGEPVCSAAISAYVIDFGLDVTGRDGKPIPRTYQILFAATRHVLRPQSEFAEEVLKNVYGVSIGVAVKWSSENNYP